MIRFRKALAIAGLLSLAWLIVRLVPASLVTIPVPVDRFAIAMWFLLAPLLLTAVGVVLESRWARFVGLAAAVAVAPWALVLTVAPEGLPTGPQAIALAGSIAIAAGLLGPRMASRYEGRELAHGASRTGARASKRRTLVTWTIICNLAALITLYTFVAAYDYRVGWHHGAAVAVLAGMLGGVALLGRDRAIGIPLIALCCAVLAPGVVWFAAKEAAHAGESILLVLAFLPAVVTGSACAVAFGGPVLRLLRD